MTGDSGSDGSKAKPGRCVTSSETKETSKDAPASAQAKDSTKVTMKAGDLQQKGQQLASAAGANAKEFLSKYAKFVQGSSQIKQLGIGAVSGWCTGFLTTRVGKTVALSVGGSIILIAVANQTGIVKMDWDKINEKIGKVSTKLENKLVEKGPQIANAKKYARTNTYFAAGFLGGFLIGLVS